ncbi:MAG: helix-turn-helix domain-containing protein [Paraclostridium sp.]
MENIYKECNEEILVEKKECPHEKYEIKDCKDIIKELLDENKRLNESNNVNYLDEVVTLKEGATLVGKSEVTLRGCINTGKFKDGVDCRKSGGTWLILKSSLYGMYGKK